MIPLSTLCRAGYGCATCRDPNAREWRQSLAVAYELPKDAPDFSCPLGLPWGFNGDGRLAGDSPDGKLRGVGDVIAAATKAIGIKPCGGCLRRQEELNRLSQAAAAVVKKVIGANGGSNR